MVVVHFKHRLVCKIDIDKGLLDFIYAFLLQIMAQDQRLVLNIAHITVHLHLYDASYFLIY